MSSSSPIITLSEKSLETLRSRGDDARLENGFRYIENSSYMFVELPETVAIPNELESLETLQFFDLCLETAQLVFHEFLQQKAEFPDRASILNSALDHIDSIEGDAYDETHDWVGVMNRIGLTTDYQTRIMDPDSSDMRLTGSAKHWATEMMTMRYEFLNGIDDTIKRHNENPNRMFCYMDHESGKLQYPRCT